MDRRLRRRAALTACAVAGGLLLADLSRTILSSLRHLFVLFGVALFISFVLEPVVSRLEKRGWRRGLATFLAMSGLGLLFIAIGATGGAVITAQGSELLDRIPDIAASLDNRLSSWGIDTDIVTMTEPGGRLDQLAQQLRDALVRSSGQALMQLGNVLALLFLVFYLSADGHKLLRAACSLLPANRQEHVVRAWELAIEKAGGYMYSRFVLAVASAALHSVAFIALKVDYPIPLALWVGVVSQLIPVVGTYLAGALPVVVALGASPGRALGVVAVLVVYQQVENLLISPRVTRSVVSVHPLAGFLSVLAFAAVLGPVGALVAIPVLATTVAFTSALLPRHDLLDKLTTEPAVPAPKERQARKNRQRTRRKRR
jgi:predicted PurR-regulated permease PerM